jgi:GT2 family glycosyltransferase
MSTGTATRISGVCAIVINYFGSDKTQRCLESLRDQALAKLLLIDNSADGPEQAKLQQVVAEVAPTLGFPLEQHNNEQNLGFGRAINAAIRQDIRTTHGHTHYLLLNNDAQATPGLVAGLMRAITNDPKRLFVAPRIQWGKDSVCFHYYQPLLGHVTARPFPGAFPYLSGCCLLVDARALADDQLFDEDFFMYGEDAELTYRLTQQGWLIHCADHLLAVHEGSGSSGSGTRFYEYHTARAHLQMARKQRPLTASISAYAGRSVYLPARAILRAVRQSSITPITSLIAALLDRSAEP